MKKELQTANCRNKQIGFFILFIALISPLGMSAKTSGKRAFTRKDYIEKYKSIAIKEMHKNGIPASITLAQGCLESSNGNSKLAKKANNHFGIKCNSSWKGKSTFHNDDRRNECFRQYNNPYESYTDHSEFLRNGQRYQFLFKLDRTDYKAWARGLKKAGYATNPRYAKLLIKIIEDNQLYKFDKVSNSEMKLIAKEKTSKAKKNSTVNPFLSREISEINGIKGIIARKNDTYNRIAREEGIKEWEILKFNEAKKGDILTEGSFVYLSLKRKKAAKGNELHKLAEGETMRNIALKYGIRLKMLYRLNRMKIGEEVAVGTTINLRKRKKKGRN